MTKITFGYAWEKQEAKRLKELEEKRSLAPFKEWVAPLVQEAVEADRYEYIAKNAVRIYTPGSSIEIEWRIVN